MSLLVEVRRVLAKQLSDPRYPSKMRGRWGSCDHLAAEFEREHPDWKWIEGSVRLVNGQDLTGLVGGINDVIIGGAEPLRPQSVNHCWNERENQVFDPVLNKFYDKATYYRITGAQVHDW